MMERTLRLIVFVSLLLVSAAGAGGRLGAAQDGGALAPVPPVLVLTIDGAIAPAYAAYLEAGLVQAARDGAQLAVVELNTPGGLLSSTREMATAIVESPVPVAVWVTPSGAHAASAGTFILYAAHIAAMDKGTNVGAATPIEMKGAVGDKKKPGAGDDDAESLREMLRGLAADPNAEALHRKALEDTTAFIRGLAALRGRNAEWAEKAVTEADSITETEALDMNVIDLVAGSRAELLRTLDGRTVTLKNGKEATLHTVSAPVVLAPPDWKTRFLALVTDPNVALLLMSIGVYGLILEFYHPGALLPGTIGAISLVLGLYAMNVLPVNAAGLALMGLGSAFMAAEVFVPSFGVLGIGGVAAFVTGATVMFDTASMPGLALDPALLWGLALCGALMVGLLVVVTLRAYGRRASTGPESMVGERAAVVEWNGRAGRVRIQGEVWKARADSTMDLPSGAAVRVEGVDDLTLQVVAEGDGPHL